MKTILLFVVFTLFSVLAAADSLVVTSEWQQLNKHTPPGTYACLNTPVVCMRAAPGACDLSRSVCAKGKTLIYGYNTDGKLSICCK